MKYNEPRFHFQKPISKAYEDGYDRIFGKRCVKRCKLGSDGVCIGCGRTSEEIQKAGEKK